MTDYIIMDETGNDGFEPWLSPQKFYIHGAAILRNTSFLEVMQLTTDLRRQVDLRSIHMSELNISKRKEIAEAVAYVLRNVKWEWLCAGVEKEFFVSDYISRIAFASIRHVPTGDAMKEIDTYGDLINLLTDIMVPRHLKAQIWNALLNGNENKLYHAFTELFVISDGSPSKILSSLAALIDAFASEKDIFALILKGRAFRMSSNRYDKYRFRQLVEHLERKCNFSTAVYRQEDNEALKKYFFNRDRTGKTKADTDGIGITQNLDFKFVRKPECEIADAMLWVTKVWHEERLRNFHTKNPTKETVPLIKPFEGNASGIMVSRMDASEALFKSKRETLNEKLFQDLVKEYVSRQADYRWPDTRP